MVYHYFNPDANQDDARPKLGAEVDALAEVYPQQTSGDGEGKRHEADDDNRQENLLPAGHAGAGERDAHRQGVDTGSDGQHQQGSEAGRVEVMVFFVAEALLNHLGPEEEQQPEGYPVVELLDEVVEVGRSTPAYQGHDGLKQAEEQPDGDECLPADATQDDATGNGYREAVHGHAHGQ